MRILQITQKLFVSVVLVVVSITLMVSATVAWFTLSTSPEITGLKVTIGGDNTILIAPNVNETTSDGQIISYPGYFSKNATLDTPSNTLLSPVSTADGINWFIPEITDDGQMDVSSIDNFTLDTKLNYANTSNGGYAYIDFWVVSPLDSCFLRICTGDEEVGSYAIQLPESIKNFTNDTGYNLDEGYQTLSASIRAGFLVNSDPIESDEEMSAYASSDHYRNEFKSLKGVYSGNNEYDFLIYEPNGLSHPNEGHSVQLTNRGLESVVCKDGEYWITKPIGLNEMNQRVLTDVADHLVVQTKSEWTKDEYDEMIINQMYQEYLKSNSDKTVSLDEFYETYLQNNFLQYVSAGHLFSNTWDLYNSGSQRVTEDEVSVLNQSNVVVDSQIVILEKNVPQKIRMFVWIEGQDVDCNYNAAGQTISLRLELAGSTGA